MTALTFVIVCLAAYRITRLLTTDVIFDAPRGWLSTHLPYPLDYLITCDWCAGAYVSAALVTILCVYFISIPLPVLVGFAVSSVVGMCGKHFGE